MKIIRTAKKMAIYSIRHVKQQADYHLGRGLAEPDRVSMILTLRCNAQCIMCDHWRDPDGNESELPAERWIEVIDELHSWIGPFVLFLVGGEVLIKKGIFDIIARGVELGLSPNIISNGIVLRSEKVRRSLYDTGLRAMNISLDGLDQAHHDTCRGVPGLHASVLQAVRDIKAERPEMTVTLVCIVMNETVGELTAFVNCACEAGADRVLFQPIGPTYGAIFERDWYTSDPYFVRDLDTLNRQIDELVALAKAGDTVGNSVEHLEKIRAYFRDPNTVQVPDGKCMAGQSGLIIQRNGDMRFCYRIDGAFGNVNDGSIREAWRSEKARELRGKIRTCREPCISLANRSYRLNEKIRLFLKYRASGRM